MFILFSSFDCEVRIVKIFTEVNKKILTEYFTEYWAMFWDDPTPQRGIKTQIKKDVKYILENIKTMENPVIDDIEVGGSEVMFTLFEVKESELPLPKYEPIAEVAFHGGGSQFIGVNWIENPNSRKPILGDILYIKTT